MMLKQDAGVTAVDDKAKTDTASTNGQAVRWIMFLPAYFFVTYILSTTGNDFVTYFISTLVGPIVAGLVAPRGKKIVVVIIAGISVLPLLMSGFLASMYNSTQITYMVISSICAVGCSFIFLNKDK